MKKFLVVCLVGGVLAFASTAMAEVGMQFGVPYMATASGSGIDSGGSGSSVMITFDVDPTVTIGVLHEQVAMTEKVGAASQSLNYSLTGLRLNKTILENYYVGIGLGSANIRNNAAATSNAPVGDVVLGTKIYPTRNKISTFVSGEVGYRFMQVAAAPNAGGQSDLSGVRVAIAVGVTF